MHGRRSQSELCGGVRGKAAMVENRERGCRLKRRRAGREVGWSGGECAGAQGGRLG
jgi:hypothetical protein